MVVAAVLVAAAQVQVVRAQPQVDSVVLVLVPLPVLVLPLELGVLDQVLVVLALVVLLHQPLVPVELPRSRRSSSAAMARSTT